MKHAKEAKQEDDKEIAAREEMIAKVLKMAKDVQSSKGANASMTHAVKNVTEGNPKLLSTVSAYLDGRMKTLSGNMAQLDAAEKKREEEIKATLAEPAGAKGNAEELKKSMAQLDAAEKKREEEIKATLAEP